MAEYTVRFAEMRKTEAALEQVSRRMAKLSDQIERVGRSTALSGTNAFAGVRRSLRSQGSRTETLGEQTGTMGSALGDIAGIYERIERELMGFQLEVSDTQRPEGTVETGVGAGAVPADGEEAENWWDSLWKMLTGEKSKEDFLSFLRKEVGNLGVLGGAVNLGDLIARGDWKNVLKNITKEIGDVAKLAEKADENGNIAWKDIFKLAPNPKASRSFLENLKNEVGKYGIPKEKTLGNWLGTAAKWTGATVDTVASWLDNFDEFHGDLSDDRFWRETLTEAGLNIGKGVLIGAIMTTVLPATASVLLVGAATAAVTVGVDWLGDVLFNGDWVETASDHINDFLETAGVWVQDTADAAADWLEDTTEAATEWFEDATGAAADWLEDTMDTVSDRIDDAVDTVTDWVSDAKDAAGDFWNKLTSGW